MKYIIDIHNRGRQLRPYGNYIYDATITIEGIIPDYSDELFKAIFRNNVCKYTEERLGGMARWSDADLLEFKRDGNTVYMRAERFYDD